MVGIDAETDGLGKKAGAIMMGERTELDVSDVEEFSAPE
jgi:hypothetical protein